MIWKPIFLAMVADNVEKDKHGAMMGFVFAMSNIGSEVGNRTFQMLVCKHPLYHHNFHVELICNIQISSGEFVPI